jgi:hypothetical protein
VDRLGASAGRGFQGGGVREIPADGPGPQRLQLRGGPADSSLLNLYSAFRLSFRPNKV